MTQAPPGDASARAPGAPRPSPSAPRPRSVLAALALLYTAQGVPFGLAAEYLPVELRRAGFSMAKIAATGWLQLPWQLKVLWAHAADGEVGRRHGAKILLGLQLLLAASVALLAVRPLGEGIAYWFTLTAVCALLASTQDVFVDALAVRTLRVADRGLGNTAQVAGYRVGMLAGGAGLLLLVGRLGERAAVLACASLVAAASVGAFVLRDSEQGTSPQPRPASPTPPSSATVEPTLVRLKRVFRIVFSAETWPVIALALSFKLGLHVASVLIKPMAVDAGWSNEQIGFAVVTVGTIGAVGGAALGGVVHRWLREPRAIVLAGVLQACVCIPLLIAERHHSPIGWTTVAIAVEHFATGLGTTVLFAVLMTATRTADAGLHYTVLTSANAVAIGLGSIGGAALADKFGRSFAFGLAGVLCLLPLVLAPQWDRAAKASAGTS